MNAFLWNKARMSLGQDLAPHLPYLRRYSRALVGTQSLGDALVRATLERIVADPDAFPHDVDPRLGLYKTFEETARHRALAAQRDTTDEEDILRPEFVERVLDAVAAGDDETARQLVQPLHPADVADLVELAARDEREGLVKALAGILSPDVLAELNEFVRDELFDEIKPDQSADHLEDEIGSDHWNRLNEQSRKALLLSGLEGFSPEDVAYLLGITTADAELLIGDAVSDLERQTRSKVLIIEPSPAVASDLKSIVRELGHAVTAVARTRSEAVAAAKAEPPALIVSEIELADGSSGIDAVEAITKSMKIPAVFLISQPELQAFTGHPEPTYLITKPYSRSTVMSAITQAIFFGTAGPPGGRGATGTAASTTAAASIPARALQPRTAPLDATVSSGRLTLAPSDAPSAALALSVLDGLRLDHQEDVHRLLSTPNNVGPAYEARLKRLNHLLGQPLTEQTALRIANQVEGLVAMQAGIEEAMNSAAAADAVSVISALSKFAKQFAVWRRFQAEAAELPPLSDEVDAALREISVTIEAQADSLVDPELKSALAEMRESDDPHAQPASRAAFALSVGNVIRAVARTATNRMKGTRDELGKEFDKRAAKVILITLSVPLLYLALRYPSEFGWLELLLFAAK